jgi:hypothetical protein
MRPVVPLLAATALAAVAHAAKLPPPNKLNLIQASCNALPPAVPGPCSTAFRFTLGTAILRSAREPGPTCPKTGQPTEYVAGDVKLTGVSKNGTPFTGSLGAQMNLKTTFGDDPNGNCELRNIQVGNYPSLTGTIACKHGTCKGPLYAVACLPAQCADTPVFSEFGSVTVNGQTFGALLISDDAGNPLATEGTVLSPAKEP